MNILVCISHVPDTTTKIKFSSDNKELDKQGVQFVIGPYDDFALVLHHKFGVFHDCYSTGGGGLP